MDRAGDTPSEMIPLRVPIEEPFEMPADLWDAINTSIGQRKISGDDAGRAIEFFGMVLESSDPRSIIANLARESEGGVEYATLIFPGSGETSSNI